MDGKGNPAAKHPGGSGLHHHQEQGRAMMIAANVPYAVRFVLYHEAYTCATQLDWLVVVEIDGVTKTRVEHWCGELPRWAKALRTWGEAGVVKVKATTTPKLAN